MPDHVCGIYTSVTSWISKFQCEKCWRIANYNREKGLSHFSSAAEVATFVEPDPLVIFTKCYSDSKRFVLLPLNNIDDS